PSSPYAPATLTTTSYNARNPNSTLASEIRSSCACAKSEGAAPGSYLIGPNPYTCTPSGSANRASLAPVVKKGTNPAPATSRVTSCITLKSSVSNLLPVPAQYSYTSISTSSPTIARTSLVKSSALTPGNERPSKLACALDGITLMRLPV